MAKILVDRAVAGGYPASLAPYLLRAASDPALFSAIETSVRSYVGAAGGSPLMFEQVTFGGSPSGLSSRSAVSAGPDRKVVENQLCTFVEEGGRFSDMATEMADSREPATRKKIDALLSDSERDHAGYRLMAANKVLRQERPDLWDAAEKPYLWQ